MRISPANVLRIDAAGCFAGAAVLLFSTTVWSWTDLPAGWRLPVAVALLLFAVLGNIGWIVAGSYALFITGTVVGGVIIAIVMIADALMAWLQSRALTGNPGT